MLSAVDTGVDDGQLAELLPRADDRGVVDERPHVRVEAAEVGLHLEDALRVVDRRLDLAAVAHDAGVAEQSFDVAFGERGDGGGIEPGEGGAVSLALVEDRAPAQARLRAFEGEELEVLGVVVRRHPPLVVVIGDHERFGPRPLAPRLVLRRRHGQGL